jgi:hypothetical protein
MHAISEFSSLSLFEEDKLRTFYRKDYVPLGNILKA